jgi:ABC-type cobalt transport system substrate-binding protein
MKTVVFCALLAVVTGIASLALSIRMAGRAGSDDRAMSVAADMRPGAAAPTARFGLQPDEQQERALFAMQAALGAGIFFYACAEIRKRRPAR